MIQQKEYIRLNNGVSIPPIAIGPGIPPYIRFRQKIKNKFINYIVHVFCRIISKFVLEPKYVLSTANALKNGYRLIDNSAAYGNEKLIKKAIKRSEVKREDLFITTRVTNNQQFKGSIREGLMISLKNLGVDYVDLYMFHWPVTDYYLSTWKEMEQLYQEGLVRVLGVANCHEHHLNNLLEHAVVFPSINQVEVHPLFTQKKLIDYCKMKGIVVESYTPIARNDDRLLHDKKLIALSKKYNKTIQQIILRWHVENGLIPVPRSLNKRRQIENISIFDFTLTVDEIKQIDSININSRLRYDPDNCDFTIL